MVSKALLHFSKPVGEEVALMRSWLACATYLLCVRSLGAQHLSDTPASSYCPCAYSLCLQGLHPL